MNYTVQQTTHLHYVTTQNEFCVSMTGLVFYVKPQQLTKVKVPPASCPGSHDKAKEPVLFKDTSMVIWAA